MDETPNPNPKATPESPKVMPSPAPATPPAPGGPASLNSRASRPRPVRAGLSLLTPFVWVLVAGAVTLGALAAAARWILFTENGTAWLLARLPMVTAAEGVQGALLGPRWQAERLRVQWDGGRQAVELHGLVSEGMTWTWRPGAASGPGPASAPSAPSASGVPGAAVTPAGATLWAALHIERLQVRRVQVQTGPPGPRPIPLPADLAPPVRVTIGTLAAEEVRYGTFEPVADLRAEGVRFDGSAQARHGVERLAARAAGVHVRGAASLANQRPFDLQAQAVVAPALLADPDAPPWAAVLRARGPLAAFDLHATLRGRPVQPPGTNGRRAAPGAGPALDAQAKVHPLEAWPVQRLVARTEALDLATLIAGAPETQLAGEVLVQAPARDAPVTVQARLENRRPGRWNERRIPARRIEVEARGELARPDRIELTRFDVQLADAMGPPRRAGGARAAVTTEDEGDAGRVEGQALWTAHRLAVQARLADVRPHRLDSRTATMTLAGPLELTIDGLPSPDRAATTTAPPWRVAGQVNLEGRVEGAPRPVSVRAEGEARADHVQLRHLQVRSGEAQAVMRLTLSRTAAREWALATEGSLAEFDPLPWWPGEADSALRRGPHRINAGWQLEVRAPADAATLAPLTLLQRLNGTGAVRLHDSVLAGVPLEGTAILGYSASGGGLRPGNMRADLQVGGNRVQFEGEGDPAGTGAGDRWKAEIRAAMLTSLAPLTRLHPSLADWVPRRGSIEADVSGAGRWPRMASEGRARTEDLQVGTLALSRAQASWRIDLTELADLRSATGRMPLSFEGQAAGLRYGERTLGDLRAELRGTLADHRIDVRATLPVAPGAMTERVLDIAAAGGGTRAHLLAQGQWQPEAGGGGRWLARIEELDLGPGARPGVAAAAAPASTAASAPAPAASPPAVTAAVPAASAPAAASTGRWADARNLRAELVFDPQMSLQTLTAEPGRVRLGDAFALRWDAVHVDFQRERADFALRADIEPFALPPLLRRIRPGVGWQGDLRLSARIDVRAADRFEADVVFQRHDGDLHIETQGELQLLGLTDFRLLLKARDGVWDFEPVFTGRGLGEIRGRLRARTTPERRWPHDDAPIEGQIRARVPDIGIWSHWLPPGWRLAGELATTADVGGRFAAPTYTGEISGRQLGVRNLLQGVNVRDGELLVRLAGTSARIETFTLRGGDGKLSATGGAELGAQPGARLTIEAERFRVLGRVDRMLSTSGKAELVFSGDSAKLDGRFRIDDGLFDFTRADAPSLDEDVTVRGAETAGPAAPAAADANNRRGQRFVMGIDIDLGERLRARGRGVDTGLGGSVRITNPNGRLDVRGTIESIGGTYQAYGQKLELEKGVLAFSGPPENPWLDIWALKPNLDIRVGLQISGPLQGLRVRLFSDPEMSETDKLSWLVLGRPSDGLGRNDTALLQRAAVALLAGEGEAPTDEFMRRLGIDELSFKQSEGDVRETVVSLGKQLSRRWYLGYERGVNATTGTWQLVYRAAQRFTLRAQSGLENSLDLIWTLRLQEPPAEGGVRKSLPALPP
ncbi:MAG: translocation/assembly module TamB domain-containing protein [Betaproteobacteria bacterium]|nr:translocation/assembly module TamB domain-containing protein [Betaproteobacteria bacterium]